MPSSLAHDGSSKPRPGWPGRPGSNKIHWTRLTVLHSKLSKYCFSWEHNHKHGMEYIIISPTFLSIMVSWQCLVLVLLPLSPHLTLHCPYSPILTNGGKHIVELLHYSVWWCFCYQYTNSKFTISLLFFHKGIWVILLIFLQVSSGSTLNFSTLLTQSVPPAIPSTQGSLTTALNSDHHIFLTAFKSVMHLCYFIGPVFFIFK